MGLCSLSHHASQGQLQSGDSCLLTLSNLETTQLRTMRQFNNCLFKASPIPASVAE